MRELARRGRVRRRIRRGQYADPARRDGAHPDTLTRRHSDTDTDTDTNPYSDPESHANTDSYAHSDTNAHSYANTDAHPDSDPNADTGPNAYPDARHHQLQYDRICRYGRRGLGQCVDGLYAWRHRTRHHRRRRR